MFAGRIMASSSIGLSFKRLRIKMPLMWEKILLIRTLPDKTPDLNAEPPFLSQWVGSRNIAMPITVSLQGGDLQAIAVKTKVYVSIDAARHTLRADYFFLKVDAENQQVFVSGDKT